MDFRKEIDKKIERKKEEIKALPEFVEIREIRVKSDAWISGLV